MMIIDLVAAGLLCAFHSCACPLASWPWDLSPTLTLLCLVHRAGQCRANIPETPGHLVSNEVGAMGSTAPGSWGGRKKEARILLLLSALFGFSEVCISSMTPAPARWAFLLGSGCPVKPGALLSLLVFHPSAWAWEWLPALVHLQIASPSLVFSSPSTSLVQFLF